MCGVCVCVGVGGGGLGEEYQVFILINIWACYSPGSLLLQTKVQEVDTSRDVLCVCLCLISLWIVSQLCYSTRVQHTLFLFLSLSALGIRPETSVCFTMEAFCGREALRVHPRPGNDGLITCTSRPKLQNTYLRWPSTPSMSTWATPPEPRAGAEESPARLQRHTRREGCRCRRDRPGGEGEILRCSYPACLCVFVLSWDCMRFELRWPLLQP